MQPHFRTDPIFQDELIKKDGRIRMRPSFFLIEGLDYQSFLFSYNFQVVNNQRAVYCSVEIGTFLAG